MALAQQVCSRRSLALGAQRALGLRRDAAQRAEDARHAQSADVRSSAPNGVPRRATTRRARRSPSQLGARQVSSGPGRGGRASSPSLRVRRGAGAPRSRSRPPARRRRPRRRPRRRAARPPARRPPRSRPRRARCAADGGQELDELMRTSAAASGDRPGRHARLIDGSATGLELVRQMPAGSRNEASDGPLRSAQEPLDADQAGEAAIGQARAHGVQAGAGRARERAAGDADRGLLDAGRQRALAMGPAAALGHQQADRAGVAIEHDDDLAARRRRAARPRRRAGRRRGSARSGRRAGRRGRPLRGAGRRSARRAPARGRGGRRGSPGRAGRRARRASPARRGARCPGRPARRPRRPANRPTASMIASLAGSAWASLMRPRSSLTYSGRRRRTCWRLVVAGARVVDRHVAAGGADAVERRGEPVVVVDRRSAR